ncbi:MAG: FHA domain-containing protein [Myxococcota bacterium]
MNALATLLSPSSYRLRVIDGPLEGTTHALADRFRIGRSGMADLQLLDERISREHAEIVVVPGESYWLVDQGSSNGTYVDGRPVRRYRLEPGTTFRIEGSAFVFEPEVSCVDSKEETFVVTHHGAPARRGTIEYDATNLSVLPPSKHKSQTNLESQADSQTTGEDDKLHSIRATYYNGMPYQGNVVEDIALFRALELRVARNELTSTRELDRYEKLADRLCLPQKVLEHDSRRRLYARFSTCFPATLRSASGCSTSAATIDIGADGAQVLSYGHALQHGDVVWLTVELLTGRRSRSLVFTCQVTWTSANHVGLAFSGHSQWRDPGHTMRTDHPFPAPIPSLRIASRR